jgi:hypothetical protein
MMQTERNIPYQSTPPVIDGKANDWKNIPFTFDPGTTLRYAIANDSANLYVCLTATNPGLEDKMFRMGLKVYFDTSGERREAIGIQFPMPVDENALQAIAAAGGNNPKTSMDEFRHFIRLQENQYQTFGFPGGGNGLNAMGSQDYVTLAWTLDAEDIFIYEMKIPLKNIYGEPIPSTVFTRSFSLGLYIDGVPRSEDPNAPVASEVGQPGSNMTGARINVGKGGRLTPNPYSFQGENLYKPQRAWIKFTMSKQ